MNGLRREAVNGQTLRRLEARRRILQAADELFEEHGGDEGGFDRVTIDMIVERAGVSRRSYFNHFATKSDALLLDFTTMIADHCGAIRQHPPDEPVFTAVCDAFVEMVQLFVDDPTNRRRAARYARLPQYREHIAASVGTWESAVAAAVVERDGTIADQAARRRARLDAAVAVLVLRLATRDWMAAGFDGDLTDYISEVRAALAADLTQQR